MWYSIIALVIGCILDFLFGDPEYWWHPIRLIGNLISKYEKILRAICIKVKKNEFGAGIILVVLVIVSVIIPVVFLQIICYRIHFILGIVVESFLCYQMLAAKSLKMESMNVYTKLKNKGIEAGRLAVARIVGRDTDQLSETEVVKATVETIAENTSDGVIAPIFYMIIGGATLGFVYKAINTMDSMVGYRNERYLYFGRAAAKVDDVVNFIPARLAALFMILATLWSKWDTKNAWRIFVRDRYQHKSPNSAQTESVMAGALSIQLAGNATYFGELYQKPTIGDANREIQTDDIIQANRLMYRTTVIAVVILVALKISVLLLIG